MGLTKIVSNIFYLFKIRKDVNHVIEINNFTHVFFIDSFDFTKFYLDKYPNKLINPNTKEIPQTLAFNKINILSKTIKLKDLKKQKHPKH